MASLSLMVVGLLAAVVVAHVVRIMWGHSRWLYRFFSLPTLNHRALPLVGHLYLFPKDAGAIYFKWLALLLDGTRRQGRKLVIFWISVMPFCSIIHPDTAEIVLKSNKLIEKPETYRKTLEFLGDGLVMSSGRKWFHRRRLLTPSFHFKILEDFLQVMNEQAGALVRNLLRAPDHSQVDLVSAITLCTLDIICETAMGVQINAQRDTEHYYVKALDRLADINREKLKQPLYNFSFFFKRSALGAEADEVTRVLNTFTRDIVRQRLAEKKEKKEEEPRKGRRLAFLDMLISNSSEEEMTLDDLQEEVDTFMFAGHDTNATSLSWTLYLLGRHPDVQRKVQAEIDAIFGEDDGEAIEVDAEHLGRMSYTEQVIKESLRLFPPVPMILRKLPEDVEMDGHVIPAGTTCSVMIFAIHRNPDVWPRPGRFEPERFDKTTTAAAPPRHPFSFVPFSAGPRNCIGQRFAMFEQKLLLAHLMRSFHVTTHVTERQLSVSIGLVTRPVGLLYSIEPRRRRP